MDAVREAVCTVFQGLTPAGHFMNARTTICKNYQDLWQKVIEPCCEVSDKITSLPRETSHDEELKEFKKQLIECRQKTVAIMPILKRDKMKAVVFGCTSSGKSTLINAMLDDDVLPTSMGVCSSCLVQIEGCDGEESSMLAPDGTTISVKELEELGTELEEKHLKAGETAIIQWPKSKCKLLDNDVVIMDRPGIGSNPEVDKIVNDKCSDADVHIFVVDSVASITTESREYFMSVAEKLSKPNIFFVYNKWDESAYQKKERNEKVQQQHKQSAEELFTKGCLDCEFDTKKIYFVSAREILWAKTNNEAPLLKGREDRKAEFNRFLEELQKSLSESAIKTKFGPHCNEGTLLCNRLDGLIQEVLDSIEHTMEELMETENALIAKTNELKAQQADFKDMCEDKTKATKEKLTQRVKEKKEELMKKLDQILEDIPFEEDDMDIYKETILDRFRANNDELHSNVEEVVTHDLADFRRDLEDHVVDMDQSNEFMRTPSTTGNKFKLRKPPTSLSDAAARDLHIDPLSYADKMAWFRRRMSSAAARIPLLGGGAAGVAVDVMAGTTGIGTGVLLLGGGIMGAAKLLERNREAKKKQILEIIMRKYKTWLDDQEHVAQMTCSTEAAELANNIKSTFNKTVDGKIDSNRNMIGSIERCIQELTLASECLKIYKKSELPNVRTSFQDFQQMYLQDLYDDHFEMLHQFD